MSAFFSAADIFIVGSHHEGSGYALMEALACGAIPVVTNIPAFRALVADSVRHQWIPGDVESCVTALNSVDPGDRGRVIEHFERELTWDVVGKRAVAIYEEVIGAKGLGIRQPNP